MKRLLILVFTLGAAAAMTWLVTSSKAQSEKDRLTNVKGRHPLSERALGQTTWIEQFDVSPDGRQLVFKSARGGNYNLWIVPTSGGEPKQLTFHQVPFRAKNPRWSPDGRWIAYQVDQHLTRQSE